MNNEPDGLSRSLFTHLIDRTTHRLTPVHLILVPCAIAAPRGSPEVDDAIQAPQRHCRGAAAVFSAFGDPFEWRLGIHSYLRCAEFNLVTSAGSSVSLTICIR